MRKKRKLKSIMCLILSMVMIGAMIPNIPSLAATDIIVPINANNFPDDGFRTYVLNNFDKNKDKNLTSNEINQIERIEIDNAIGPSQPRGTIRSLKGIEYFTYLKFIWCCNNSITSIDVSKNRNLEWLSIPHNLLSELDVSNNIWLERLDCGNNSNLKNIRFGDNPYLEVITCGECALEEINTGTCGALKEINCKKNKFTHLDFKKNIKLENLYCAENNQLMSLDVSENIILKGISCYDTGLTQLDVTHNTQLDWLACDSTGISNLDLSNNKELTDLNCSSTKLEKLNVNNNIKLQSLNCEFTPLKEIDISNNKALKNFHCGSTKLEKIDVSNNTNLEEFYCYGSQITNVDTSNLLLLKSYNFKNNNYAIADGASLTELTLNGFDIYKVKNVKGGNFDNGKVNFKSSEIVYTYNIGREKYEDFTLIKHTGKVNYIEEKPATCMEDGKKGYYQCECCKRYFENKELTKKINDIETWRIIPKINHDWVVKYQWSEDGLECRAIRECKNDSSHKEIAIASITEQKVVDPTCTEKGKTFYIAEFKEDWAITQKKIIADIPIKGHDWGQTTYEWSEDGSECRAIRECKNDPSHKETIKGRIIKEEKTKATCLTKGETIYIAIFNKDWAVEQQKVIADIPAKGHTFSTNYLPEHADEQKHYHVCTDSNCKVKDQGESHTFVWVTDKEATTTEKGMKHEECSVCKYKKEAVEIPMMIVPEEKPEEKPEAKPEEKPEAKPEEKTETTDIKGKKVDTKLSDVKALYQVTKSDDKAIEVTYLAPKNKNAKLIQVPETVLVEGITYKVTSIAKDAFKNNKYLQKVIIGKNIKKIDKKAFYGCKKLKSVTLGKELTVIEDDAFRNCTSLTKVIIPSKVTKIDQSAFYGCKKLKKITIKSKKLKTVGKNAIKNINKKAYIDVPKSKVKAYKKLFKSKTGYKKSMKLK